MAYIYRSLHVAAGFPKASMEAAIARGQGRSISGAALENVTLEVIVPPSVAMIVDAETDNRNRTLADLRAIVKRHGGSVTPTTYLFQKKGRISFEKDDRNLGVDEVLEEAIEAGAEDVEADDEGNIVVWTEPNKTTAAAKALLTKLDLKVQSSDIIWDANNDTKVALEPGDAVQTLIGFIDALQEEPNILGVYANVAQGSLGDKEWEALQGRLDA
ncbi:hypothetical protein B7494_g2418 [Chlorociboria aeruginascens]|nr:hypothetical protein B7494_g2418 [Chlorociboria aeruginascens]